MARTKNPAPNAARSAADTAPDPAPAPVTPPAGDSPAAAVLAALTAEPGGATVTVIAGHAGITVAAALQALAAHEKAGTATRVKGGRPGIPDTWKPTVGEATAGPDSEPDGQSGAAGPELAAQQGEAPPAQVPVTDGTGEPTIKDGAAETRQPVGNTAGGEAEASTALDPDPAIPAEAAGNASSAAQAAEEAGKALAAGDLPAPLAALDTACEQAAQARRVLKAAASGRHAPATRPGGLRDLVAEHLRTFPGTSFTPHQIGKVLTRSSGAVANALDKLVSLGTAELAADKPRSYRLAPGPDTPGDPSTSTETTASAA